MTEEEQGGRRRTESIFKKLEVCNSCKGLGRLCRKDVMEDIGRFQAKE